jgi:hypothetical protein
MKCERHSWDIEDKEWCWKCEELTINENKKKYEDKFCDNGLQGIDGNKDFGSLHTETQETSGRDSDSL